MIRIGCGSGFWGDSAAGPAQLVRQGKIDFLVLDYLAEITMSILSRAKQKKPELGYATDFVDTMMAPLAREIAEKKIKVVANAGGVNPRGCGEALARALAKQGVDLKIAVVLGDDVQPQIPALRERGAKNLETGGAIPEALISANAYLGAKPIADALKLGADVVITGRCVDSAVALGPLIATFGWKMDDWDKLAMGSLAGHVIECGVQAT
ncbi:MAG: acyclic terpene utilization AtuA family protein, partial [Polyangiaceae bacterium]